VRTIVGALALAALSSVARAGPHAGGEDALAAFVGTEFREVRRLADLPDEVRKALGVDAYPMAEAGADWNPGCVTTKRRPNRRFILAGQSRDLWVVLFETGARAHYCVVVTLRRAANGTFAEEGLWSTGTAILPVTTVRGIKDAVREADREDREWRERTQ
jgi:hypothetical protein